MALGGGNFITQNKAFPGTYINFVSAARASSLVSDRGVVALALELDWGIDGDVFAVTADEFRTDSLKLFGYSFDHAKMTGLRDLFKNCKLGYFYKLMNTGVAASNTFGTAACKGVRGNDLKTVISTNVNDGTKKDVQTYLGTVLVDTQTVLPNTDNLVDTEYVIWKSNVVIVDAAGTAMTLGSNGVDVTGTEYAAFLAKIESYSFNVLGCLSVTESIVALIVAFAKRMRDENGVKFQAVVYHAAADYEGVISVENTVTDIGAIASALVYWVTGAASGCAVNKSNTNKVYDGEYSPVTDYTQSALAIAIAAGKFMFHKVGLSVRVLTDINTLVTFTVEKSSDFCGNQTIRVLDQIANDIGAIFNTKYLGNVANTASGRISLWNDIVSHHKQLETIGAIENFDTATVIVSAGIDKKSVVVSDVVIPTNSMEKLYMTIVVA